MNKITSIIVGAMLIILPSCSKDFLNTKPENSVDSENSITSVMDLNAAVNGIHRCMRDLTVFGRHNLVMPEVVTDAANVLGASNNTYYTIEAITYVEGTAEFQEVFENHYLTMRTAVSTIRGGKKLLEEGGLTTAELNEVNTALATAYGAKALCLHMLAQYFCEAYISDANAATKKGMPLIKEEFASTTGTPDRGTLKATYDQILEDIQTALNYAATDRNAAYLTKMGILALKSRVLLAKADFAGAATAAQEAITYAESKGKALATTSELATQFATVEATNEDLFILTVTSAESAGYYSAWQMFASMGVNGLHGYGCRLSAQGYMKYSATDLRRTTWYEPCPVAGLCDAEPPSPYAGLSKGYGTRKYVGIGNNLAKIPILRLSEQYLILAEALNETSGSNAAQTLLNVAQRDPNITLGYLQGLSKEDFRQFVWDERARELALEGHRLFDLKRTGQVVNRTLNDARTGYPDWTTIQQFVFPIPLHEVNTTGIAHDEDWHERKPDVILN